MNERMKRDVLAILADLDSGANGGDVHLAELPRATAMHLPHTTLRQRDPDRMTNLDRAIVITAVLASCLLSVWMVTTTVRYGWSWVWVVR